MVADLLPARLVAKGRRGQWASELPAVHVGLDQCLGTTPKYLAESRHGS